MRSPLTETIRRVQEVIKYAQDNLSEDEYLLFLDLLVPEVEKPAVKKPRKKRASKSPRATSLRQQISGTGVQRCEALVDDKACGEPRGHALHEDKAYANYHPFVSSSGATSVGRQSSSKRGAATGSTQSIEGQPENALAVTGN